MNIAILDKLAFSDEQLAKLRAHGAVTQYDDFPDAHTAAQRLREADIAIVGWTSLPKTVLEPATNLKYIALAQTGYEFVDVATAKARGIVVSNSPGYSRQSVAEYAFALMLAALRHIPAADRVARQRNVPPEQLLGNELCGKTLGILGLGSIGRYVGKIGQGFGMRVIGHSRSPKNLPGITDVSLDELLAESDVLVVAVDVNEQTSGLLSKERLQQMKPGAALISVVSNEVLDEQALAELLRAGHIKCAAFDQISEITPGTRHPLDLQNVILSPQAGWYTVEAERRLLDLAIENVAHFVAGRPRNVII